MSRRPEGVRLYAGVVKTSVLGSLEKQAALHPAAVALVVGEEEVSFAELLSAARRVSAQLRDFGVCADRCVGLFADSGRRLVEGCWGILGAGGAYLPLSPEYPRNRLRYMLEHSGAHLVLTHESALARAREIVPQGTRVLTVEECQRKGDDSPFAVVGPEDLAYVIYTSGSTGRPKGVMIEHQGIANQMRWLALGHAIGRSTRLLHKTPFSFDAAQWELLAPACGATVVIAPPGTYRDPAALGALVREHAVTALQCVPTLWAALADDGRIANCPSLRQLFSGGEVLSTTLAQRLLDMVPGATLTNLYGPTETTINATAHSLGREPGSLAPGGSIPIGRPVANTGIVVVDSDMNPVRPGVTGEICVTGIQVARGYLNDSELTRERFSMWKEPGSDPCRLYRTGDMGYLKLDGSLMFAGRRDHQVKLRGYRIELDEVRATIEQHRWIRQAAVVPWKAKSDTVNLAAVIRLDPDEAALMDQGLHGPHHQSKATRQQVKAQLARLGVRDPKSLRGCNALPLAAADPRPEQVRLAFERKTYRYYDGPPLERSDLLALLKEASCPAATPGKSTGSTARVCTGDKPMTLYELGVMLRWLGPFHSAERLLPKFAYASPGALYATQMYLESPGGPGMLPIGVYYFHPERHELYLVGQEPSDKEPATSTYRIHLVGCRSAIREVYLTNVDEVLHMEAGHMLGVLERAVVEQARTWRVVEATLEVPDLGLDAADHVHLVSVELCNDTPAEGPRVLGLPEPAVHVQAMGQRVAGLPEGLYRFTGDDLVLETPEIIERRHVIAINQAVFDRAAFGVTWSVGVGTGWRGFVALGLALQRMQMNDRGFGAMSSGYGSLTGRPLPAARRFDGLVGATTLSYFAVGGRISDEQLHSRGMQEDTVHMRGPAEILRDDLAQQLPAHMVPTRVMVVDEMPLNCNGKVDLSALREMVEAHQEDKPFVPPTSPIEHRLHELWCEYLEVPRLSVKADFFEAGGDSLLAVAMINAINGETGGRLPLQVLFEAPTIEGLARRLEELGAHDPCLDEPRTRPALSRLVHLAGAKLSGCEPQLPPVYLWPGLGGYPLGLRALAEELSSGHIRRRAVVGVQAYGLNAGERPFASLAAMVRADTELVLSSQPDGPFTLLGYSFGARLAFEVARSLQRLGHCVERLILVAPGQPSVPEALRSSCGYAVDFTNRQFVAVLLSVFAGRIDGELVSACMERVNDEEGLVSFVAANFPHLGRPFVRRVVRLVAVTNGFGTQRVGENPDLRADVAVITARGDQPSFAEDLVTAGSIMELAADHYSSTRSPEGITELCSALSPLLGAGTRQ